MARIQIALILAAIAISLPTALSADEPPIKIGVLHSLTGTMAISELSLVDAIKMAISEINQKGGVLGRQLEPIIEDGASDWPTFARKAKKLIVEDQVASVFGCWTSASRKAVKPIFEEHNHLLWYPVQYEGNESSGNIIYTGAAPNQQITPAVRWCHEEFGGRMFLVGSDYIFPRTANNIIRLQLESYGLVPVGEEYVPLGSKDFDQIVAQIKQAKPHVVLNTINGDSNRAFFRALKSAGITPLKIPVMSFSIAEDELRDIGVARVAGHYCSWNYFQSIHTPANQRFVRAFKARYGADRVTDDPIEAAYFQVHLFAKAVEQAGSTDIDAILREARGLVYAAPEGLVRIDPRNLHTWKVSRIGRIRNNGQFKIVWSSQDPLPPRPFLPQSFLAEARTQGEIMFQEISTMMELPFAPLDANEGLKLLKSMADVSGYQGETRTRFQNAVMSMQPRNRVAFEQSWKEFSRRWMALSRLKKSLTPKQLESFDRLEQARSDFNANAQHMFQTLYAEKVLDEVSP